MSWQNPGRTYVVREQNAEHTGSDGSRRRVVIGLVGLTVLAVGLPVLVRALGGGEYLRTLVEGAGAWAPVAYIAAKAAATVVAPLVGTPMKAASGTLFGLWEGVAYSVLGDTIGGCVCYGISRSLGRGFVARFVGEKRLDRVDELARSLGEWRALLFARLILSAAYNVVSFAAGLTKLPFRHYLAVTVLGGIAHTGFLVAFGASATLDRRTLLAAYAGLAALALLALLGRRRLRRALEGWWSEDKASDEDPSAREDSRSSETGRGKDTGP